MAWLTPGDLCAFAPIDPEQAEILIEQAEAMAKVIAPCLAGELSADQIGMAKGIISTAILRWHDAGLGGVTQETNGPHSVTVDTRVRRGQFWPSEIKALQRICKPSTGKAFMIDPTTPRDRPFLEQRPDLKLQFE